RSCELEPVPIGTRILTVGDPIHPINETTCEFAIVVGVAGREIKMPIRRDRTGGTGGNAELAFQTRAEVERSGIRTDFRVQQNGPEKNKVAKLGMNDVAMNAHPTKTGRFGNGLMRYQPLLACAEPVHFNRKADGSCIY